jgi:hypothetical protein
VSRSFPDVPTGLRLPAYGPANLGAVLPSVAAALGAPLPGLPTIDHVLPPVERACVVLVDGLGLRMLQERGGHAPFLRSRLAQGRALSTGFPSTTAASLGAFGTGRPPGQTGLLGYTVLDPASGELTNLLTWGGSARPEEWQRYPTVLELVDGLGVGVLSVGKERFRGSGLTVAALRGGDFAAAGDLANRVDVAVQALRRGEHRLVYLYWGDVDTVGHHSGWGSWQWGEQVEAVDRELARLARSLPRGTVLVVTADHGMVDVGPGDRVDVAATPGLAEGVRVVAGEPRAVHVHCEEGEGPRVLERWRDVLGDTAWVLTREEAITLGLFGPVDERHRLVIGDVVAAARGTSAVVDSRTQSPQSLALVGMHGSLTDAEVLVPLVVELS